MFSTVLTAPASCADYAAVLVPQIRNRFRTSNIAWFQQTATPSPDPQTKRARPLAHAE